MTNNDFSWKEAEAEGDVVVRSVQAIAVYINGNNDVVIRQQKGEHEHDQDSFVVLPKDRISALITQLKKVSKGEVKNELQQ